MKCSPRVAQLIEHAAVNRVASGSNSPLGTMKRVVISAALAVLLVTIGCGVAGAAESNSGVTPSGNTVSRNGCTVDLARVCRDFLSQQWTIIGNFPRQGRRLRIWVPYNYPDGRPLATVK